MECNHDWETCPVHSRTDGELPTFQAVLSCLYELDDAGAEDVVEGVCQSLERLIR